MKDRINEHEMTQKMMEIMRGGYKLLLEDEMDTSSDQVNPTDLDQNQEESEPSDSIQLEPTDATYQEQLATMQNAVNDSVRFTAFNIYPSDANVVIDGYLLKRSGKDSGVFFKMALTSSDIETSMVDVELDDKVNDTLKRLTGYYSNFEDEWNKRISEYQKSSNE